MISFTVSIAAINFSRILLMRFATALPQDQLTVPCCQGSVRKEIVVVLGWPEDRSASFDTEVRPSASCAPQQWAYDSA